MKVEEAMGSGWRAKLNIQLQCWDPEARAREARVLGFWPEWNVSSQGKPVFFQQTSCSAPEGFKLEGGEFQGESGSQRT